MLTSLWQLLLHEGCPPPASEYLSTETKERYVYQFQFGQTCVKTESHIHVMSHKTHNKYCGTFTYSFLQ